MCDKHTLHSFGGRNAKDKTHHAFGGTNKVIIHFDLEIWQEYNFNLSVGNVPKIKTIYIYMSNLEARMEARFKQRQKANTV